MATQYIKCAKKCLKIFFFQIIGGGGAWPLLARGWLRSWVLIKVSVAGKVLYNCGVQSQGSLSVCSPSEATT